MTRRRRPARREVAPAAVTRRELLAELRDLELALHAPAVQARFEKQPPEVRQRFVEDRLEISHYVALLAHAELADIQGQLARLEPELRDGIARLSSALDAAARTAAILNALTSLLGPLARVLALA